MRPALLFFLLPALLAPLFVPWPSGSAAPAAPAAPAGPGSVLDMHVALLAALDAGDAEKAASFVEPDGSAGGLNGGLQLPSAMLLGAHELPILAQGREAVREALRQAARASKDGGPAWTSKIVRSRADCASSELSYAIFEFERSRGVKGGTRLYRATSLVRYVDGHWKLFHLHVSAADVATARLAGEGLQTR